MHQDQEEDEHQDKRFRFFLGTAIDEQTMLLTLHSMYRKKCWIRSKILDSLMSWPGEKRKTEFSWTQANQAMSESRIFERIQHFLRYTNPLDVDMHLKNTKIMEHFYM